MTQCSFVDFNLNFLYRQKDLFFGQLMAENSSHSFRKGTSERNLRVAFVCLFICLLVYELRLSKENNNPVMTGLLRKIIKTGGEMDRQNKETEEFRFGRCYSIGDFGNLKINKSVGIFPNTSRAK